MLIRKRLLVDMCGQQRRARFPQRQAPAIARYGDETHVARILMKGNLVEQASNTDTSPALGAIEPTGTIQRCLQGITRRSQFVVGEVAGRSDGAAKREPPGLRIQGTRLIGNPACGGEDVPGVAAHLARAGEAPSGARQIQDTLGELLSWPERYTGQKQGTEIQSLSSSGNIAFAQPFGAREHMQHDGRCDREAQSNMPVQQIEPGKVQIAARGPPDACSQRYRDQQQRQQSIDGAAIPAPGMDQSGPDAAQLAPQEQQQPEASYAMQHEDGPILREATHQADHASREGEEGGECNAPVGEARGHTRLSFCDMVSFYPKRGGPFAIFTLCLSR